MKKLQIILLVLFTLISVKAQETIIMDSDVTINSSGFIDNLKRLASGIR